MKEISTLVVPVGLADGINLIDAITLVMSHKGNKDGRLNIYLNSSPSIEGHDIRHLAGELKDLWAEPDGKALARVSLWDLESGHILNEIGSKGFRLTLDFVGKLNPDKIFTDLKFINARALIVPREDHQDN